MLRVFIDQAAEKTVKHVEVGASTTVAALSDRNPANFFGITADANFSVALGDNITPCSGLAVFGLSENLLGGSITAEHHRTNPVFGDFGTPDYEYNINGFNFWMPFDEVGYDTSPDNYYRYWKIQVLVPPGFSGTATVGVIALGLLEQPKVNYQWGSTRGYASPNVINTTMAGVDYVAQLNTIPKKTFAASWPGLDEQGIHQIRRWYTDANEGLDPMVVIPDDSGHPGECLYARMSPEFSVVEQFAERFPVDIEWTEAIGREA